MIRVNEEPIPWREGMTVSDVLKACRYNFPMIIVSINGMIVPRDQYATHKVNDNDEIKAIHVYGGG